MRYFVPLPSPAGRLAADEQLSLIVLSFWHRKEARGFGTGETQEASYQVLITIEKARQVLAGGGFSTRVFRECAIKGRKFGVGLCVITRQPKNVDLTALAQITTFVVMGCGNRGDRDIIRGSEKTVPARDGDRIQVLDRREAIISTIGIPFRVCTRIHRSEDHIAALNTER